jgi:hypothetical protein
LIGSGYPLHTPRGPTIQARDLSSSDPHGSEPPSIRAGASADHHIPHTGNDHDKTYSIYKIGISSSWPWSGASTHTCFDLVALTNDLKGTGGC